MDKPIDHSQVTLRRVTWRDHWSTFLAMVRKELIVITRYPVSFVASFGQVFLIVTVVTLGGLMFSNQVSSSNSSEPNLGAGVSVYGFMLFMFISDTLWTIGFNVRHEQVQGTLEQLYLSPASKFATLIARVANLLVWTGLLTIAGAALMASMIGRLPFFNPGLGAYLLVMTLMGTFGVGFAFAALTLRLRETANTLANLLQFAVMILCANFFPFSVLPPVLHTLSYLIPLSYSVDAFRSTMMNYPAGFPELAPIEVEIIIVTIFGLVMPLFGYWMYRRAEDHARRSGSLSEI